MLKLVNIDIDNLIINTNDKGKRFIVRTIQMALLATLGVGSEAPDCCPKAHEYG